MPAADARIPWCKCAGRVCLLDPDVQVVVLGHPRLVASHRTVERLSENRGAWLTYPFAIVALTSRYFAVACRTATSWRPCWTCISRRVPAKTAAGMSRMMSAPTINGLNKGAFSLAKCFHEESAA